MKKYYTPNDLISLLYNETTVSQKLALEEALDSQPEWALEYRKMRQTVRKLDSERYKPSATSLRIIMDYSSSKNQAAQPH